MNKLEVLLNKKLVLKNVIKDEVRNIQLDELEIYITKFLNKVEILKVQTFGPLVIKNYGICVSEDGETITTNYDLFLQAYDYKQYKNEFIIEEKHTCNHCAYIHFNGKMKNVNYAQYKMELFFYENEILDSGILYSVYLNDDPEHTIIDFFKPVKYI